MADVSEPRARYREEPSPIRRDWLAVFGVFAILFAATANRGPQWQDSGWHIWRVVTHDISHPLGLALAHPLHHWLGRLAVWFNLLEPCFAVTMVSSIAGAVAVANVYGCVFSLTRRRSAALLAALSLGVAHTFWQMATRVESYTLAMALLSGECWCLALFALRRRPLHLSGAFLLNGLGVANHMLGALTAPVLLAVGLHGWKTGSVRVKSLCLAIVLWLLGSLPYTGLVVAEAMRTGDATAAIRSALFGSAYSEQVLGVSITVRSVVIMAAFVLLNFPNLLLPAAFLGVIRGPAHGMPRVAWWAYLAGWLIHTVFAARYNVTDQHTFFLPSYVLLSIFAGVGFALLCASPATLGHAQPCGVRSAWWCRWGMRAATATLALTPALYAIVPAVARKFDVLGGVERNKPYREDYVYVFSPWSVLEDSAERLSHHAVALAGKRGLILVEDSMARHAIRYRALRDGNNEVMIRWEWEDEMIRSAVAEGRPVVLVPKDVSRRTEDPPVGSWQRIGDLYLLNGQ